MVLFFLVISAIIVMITLQCRILKNYVKCFFILATLTFIPLIPLKIQTQIQQTRQIHRWKAFQNFINKTAIENFKAYVSLKHSQVLKDHPKQLPGDICERFRKQPYEEKLFMKSFWGPTFLKDSRDVTLVTQLSYSRLDMLIRVLKHWPGPVSACIYVTWTEFIGLQKKLQSIPEIVYRKNIVFQIVLKNEEFYPVNFLRNVALNGSLTEYVFLSDVDFVPSIGSHERLKHYVLSGLCNDHQVLVIPAFEFLKTGLPFPQNKAELLKIWRKKKVDIFHRKTYRPGQHSTDYAKWINSTTVYKITPRRKYEPYIVMKKSDAPVYRENFLGRSNDKISFTLEVIAKGFRLLAVPDVFCIHIPHETISEASYFKCSAEEFNNYLSLMKSSHPDTMKNYPF